MFKKIIFNIITITIICLFIIASIFGIKLLLKNITKNVKNEEQKIENIDLIYTFTGKSEHFSFEKGIAEYHNEKRSLKITNFNILDDNIKICSIKLFFNDQLFYENNYISKNELENLIIREEGEIFVDDEGNYIGELDAFLMVKPNDFKDNIKIEMEYCNLDGCYTENLNIIFK